MPRPPWIGIYLRETGWPDTPYNSLALDLWAISEGMPDSWHNYLATGISSAECSAPAKLADGSSNVDHVAYCANDLAGAVNFRENMTLAYYKDVGPAFKQPDSKTKLEQIYLAINRSAYCPNCQSGRYPIALYNYIYGRVPPKDRPGLTKPPLVPPPVPSKNPKPVHLVTGWNYLIKVLHHDVPSEGLRAHAAGLTALRVVKWSKKRPRKP